MVGTFVLINLVVAVILENFTSLGNINSDLVSREDIEAFNAAWAAFDPSASQKISATDLPELVRQLEPPMGLKGAPMRWAVRMCLNLGLRQDGGYLHFSEVLAALVSHNYKQQMQEGLPPPNVSTKGLPTGGLQRSSAASEASELQRASRVSEPANKGELWASGKQLTSEQQDLASMYALLLLRLYVRHHLPKIRDKLAARRLAQDLEQAGGEGTAGERATDAPQPAQQHAPPPPPPQQQQHAPPPPPQSHPPPQQHAHL